jgi:hypothetical protein
MSSSAKRKMAQLKRLRPTRHDLTLSGLLARGWLALLTLTIKTTEDEKEKTASKTYKQ